MNTKVMLETNTLKFAATKLRRLIPVNRPTYNDKGKMTGILLYDDGYINPNDKISDPELKKEADLLPQIAELAKSGKFELLLDREATYEAWGVRKMNGADGLFYGATVNRAESPTEHTTALFGGGIPPEQLALGFFANINNERYRKLAKITGGYQGKDKWNLNQLRDAFFIWSAEYNNCEFMLTLDFKLMRMLSHAKNYDAKVRVVKPSELMAQIT